MESRTVYIYGLFDPQDSRLRYIGKTTIPRRRLSEHILIAKRMKGHNPHLEAWIRRLLDKKLKPVIQVLETVPENDWEEAEKWWIKTCRLYGFPLTNIDEGGAGLPSGENSYFYGVKGKDHPTYGLRRFGEENPMWGREQSERTKALIGEKVKAAYSDPTRTPWYGKHLTDEHKKKLSEVKRGKKQSKEFAENLSVKMGGEGNPMYGRKHSPEAVGKMKVSYALHVANRKGNLGLVLELQEEYFKLYGKYHEKYPSKGSD